MVDLEGPFRRSDSQIDADDLADVVDVEVHSEPLQICVVPSRLDAHELAAAGEFGWAWRGLITSGGVMMPSLVGSDEVGAVVGAVGDEFRPIGRADGRASSPDDCACRDEHADDGQQRNSVTHVHAWPPSVVRRMLVVRQHGQCARPPALDGSDGNAECGGRLTFGQCPI
jgi:hypothetical protein